MEHDTVNFILTLFFPDVGETGLDCLRFQPIRAYLYALAIVNSTLHGQILCPHPTYPRSVPIIFRAIRNFIVHAALQAFSREYLIEATGIEGYRPPARMLHTTDEETEEQLRQLFIEPTTATTTTTNK